MPCVHQWYLDSRRKHYRLGYYPHASGRDDFVWCILCSAILVRYLSSHIRMGYILTRTLIFKACVRAVLLRFWFSLYLCFTRRMSRWELLPTIAFLLLIHLRVNECRGFMWWCVCSFCHLNFIQIDFCQNGTHVPTWQSLRIQHSSRLNANIRGLRRIRNFILWWSPARTLQDHIFPAWWACNHRGTMCHLVAPRLSCARSVVDEGRKDCSAGASPWRPRWNRE